MRTTLALDDELLAAHTGLRPPGTTRCAISINWPA